MGSSIVPERCAVELRHELGITNEQALNVDLAVKHLGIHVKRSDFKGNTLGACKVVGLRKLIVISNRINNQGQYRFTVAHEIGHVLMHHGAFACTTPDFQTWASKKIREREANKFAAELLTPMLPIRHCLKSKDVSFDLAVELAHQYGSSLLSTVLRLIELCQDKVILFYQIGGSIKWVFSSPTFSYECRTGLVDPDSISCRTSAVAPRSEGNVPPETWLVAEEWTDDIRCSEQAWFLKGLGATISIVSVQDDEW